MKFGLLGKSISHSKSPLLFSAAYPLTEHTYDLLDFESIESGIEYAIANGFAAINVTTPFKERAADIADSLDGCSMRSGAANLLYFKKGKIHGFNTDYQGVMDSLKEYAFEGMKAVVLGCGGAGRSAAVALKDMGVDVVISNREEFRGEIFAMSAKIAYCRMDSVKECAKDAHIIVDTIPVRHLKLSGFNFSDKVVLEARYMNPTLKRSVINDGGIYISGMHWLLNQAIPSFRIFTGREPDIEAMQNLARNW